MVGAMESQAVDPRSPLRYLVPAAALALGLATAACVSPDAELEPSGFLQTYEGFEPHPEREGAYLWTTEAEIPPYQRVLLDPITVWYAAREGGASQKDLRDLADDFLLEIHRALGNAYPMTQTPGPGVMRLRIAVTDVGQATGMRKTLRVISGRGAGTTGTSGGHENTKLDIDAVTIEVEALDSLTGERLVALVERKRAPGNEATTDTWRSIQGALRQWSGYLRETLDELSR